MGDNSVNNRAKRILRNPFRILAIPVAILIMMAALSLMIITFALAKVMVTCWLPEGHPLKKSVTWRKWVLGRQ